MKAQLSQLLTLTLLGAVAHGQAFGPQQTLTNLANGAESVHAVDLDGDGDIDVLSASYSDDRIDWYENLGGGTFGPRALITDQADGATSVYAADLDEDGDIDVLSSSWNEGRMAWYENTATGGTPTFGPQQVVSPITNWGWCIYAADMDQDGDVDILTATSNEFAWHENNAAGGGTGFGPKQTIHSASSGRCIFAADLDGDGDPEVLTASAFDDRIAWHENLGGGAFGSRQTITTLADGAWCVYTADLDNDGDQDVLSASVGDSEISWYENLEDGTGTASFGLQQIITTNAEEAWSVHAADLDNDGDMDVLSASGDHAGTAVLDKIAWYENQLGSGKPSFGSQQLIDTSIQGGRDVFAADLSGDGRPDVLSASFNDDRIAWYRNLLSSGTQYCFGGSDGSTCPCGNDPSNQAGCENGTGMGSVLTPGGAPSVSSDTLVMSSTHLPPSQPCLYFQGNNAINGGDGVGFGDGLRCAGGSVIRLQVQFASASGEAQTSLAIALAGGCSAGDLKRYQAWYRDPLLTPCGTGFNLSNGVEVTWGS